MTRCFVLAAALALQLTAQPQKPPDNQTPAPAGRPGAQRVFILKYADPLTMADMLRVFGVMVVANPETHAVAVATTFPDVLTSVDDAINRLDVPTSAPQNIELTAYYVIGGNTNSPLGSPLPKDLESLATELASTAAVIRRSTPERGASPRAAIAAVVEQHAARTTRGLACPAAATPKAAVKSRNFLPSASQT